MTRTTQKKVDRLLLMSWIMIFISSLAMSQTFPCDGRLLLSTNQGTGPTVLYKVFIGPFGATGYDGVAAYADAFDALGFNPIDNYIYAVKHNTNEIVRLKSDRTTETIGTVALVDTLRVGAGDATPEGNYIIFDNQLDQFLVFDVIDDFKLVNQIDLYWDPLSSNEGKFMTKVEDIAIDPNNPTVAYTYQGDYQDGDLAPDATRGFLHRININMDSPELGMVTPIGKVSSNVVEQVGGLFFSTGGQLMGYGGDSRSFNFLQDKLISIDRSNGSAGEIGTGGPIAKLSDGCSCPYNLSFENDAFPRDVLCTNAELTYKLTINNRFFQGINDIVLTDTLPKGMIIKEIIGEYSGEIDPQTGVGTNLLRITNLNIPPKEAVVIEIVCQVIDIEINFIANQAHISNLPERIGGSMISDDPQTVGAIGDSTEFYGTPILLNSIDIAINHPTDCLDPIDGTLNISAPELIIGEQYRVNLRNEDFALTSWDVIIDENNSFLLQEVLPGTYELSQIEPQSSSCSFAMKDTTIEIIGPNEQLQAYAESNGPICEFMPLELRGWSTPVSTITWKGPLDYQSIESSPTISEPIASQSGIYEMTASYGVCKQIKELNIDISPEIKAAIDGDNIYCERDTMLLVAEGIGDIKSFQWRMPNGTFLTDSSILNNKVSMEYDGSYELVIDNGSCRDTAYADITINPSPTISLEDSISTHFCDPLQLKPEVSSDIDVVYRWEHSGNLSCDDCPDPQVFYPIQPNYKLFVNNQFNCQDSSVVSISLLKDKLIYIPNAFSPNNDNINDRFVFSPGCGLQEIKMIEIFDRSGTTVYTEQPVPYQDPNIFWDGMIRGKKATTGIYFWQSEIELSDGTQQRLTGNLQLIR